MIKRPGDDSDAFSAPGSGSASNTVSQADQQNPSAAAAAQHLDASLLVFAPLRRIDLSLFPTLQDTSLEFEPAGAEASAAPQGPTPPPPPHLLAFRS